MSAKPTWVSAVCDAIRETHGLIILPNTAILQPKVLILAVDGDEEGSFRLFYNLPHESQILARSQGEQKSAGPEILLQIETLEAGDELARQERRISCSGGRTRGTVLDSPRHKVTARSRQANA